MAANGDRAVGVDFGTSTSLVAERESWDLADVLPLGRGELEKWFPSIALRRSGKFVVGEDADLPAPAPVIRSIKRAITENRQTVPVDTPRGVRNVEADPVVSAVLGEIAQRSKDAGLPLDSEETLRLGCPAMWDGDQRRRILSLAAEAGIPVTDATLVDEPVAAGVAWLTYRYLRHRESPQGRLLVFDMGGGTLDLAVLDVVGGERPEVSVLSALGIATAGDDLDRAIAKDLSDDLARQGLDPNAMTAAAGSELLRQARLAKTRLSRSLDWKIQLNPHYFAPISSLGYTRERLEEVFRPQMENAVDRVWAALRAARLTEEFAASPSELRAVEPDELSKDIKYVLLAGGMSRVPYVMRRLGELLPRAEIFDDVGLPPDEAIVAGLADTVGYERINIHRPAFDFILEWDDTQRRRQRRKLYQAYTPLYQSAQVWLGHSFLGHEWRAPRGELPYGGTGVVRVQTSSGEHVSLDFDGQAMDGLQVQFGSHRFLFKIYCNGRILLSDGAGSEFSARVGRWPVIRGQDYFTKLLLGRIPEAPDPPVPWYLIDDD